MSKFCCLTTWSTETPWKVPIGPRTSSLLCLLDCLRDPYEGHTVGPRCRESSNWHIGNGSSSSECSASQISQLLSPLKNNRSRERTRCTARVTLSISRMSSRQPSGPSQHSHSWISSRTTSQTMTGRKYLGRSTS